MNKNQVDTIVNQLFEDEEKVEEEEKDFLRVRRIFLKMFNGENSLIDNPNFYNPYDLTEIDTDFRWEKVLCLASEYGLTDIAQSAILYGAVVNYNRGEALISASQEGYEDIVRLLLNVGADTSWQYDMAIKEAADNNHIRVVKLLIENGADDSKIIGNPNLDTRF